MLVKELIAELENYDPEMDVVTAFPSHDYWRNECAGDPDKVSEEFVEWSEYHRTWKTVSEEEEDEIRLSVEETGAHPKMELFKKAVVIR